MLWAEDIRMNQHTPIAEQQRLVSQWRNSHRSISAYAQSIGIPESTFSTWTRKYRPEVTAVARAPSFIEVTPAPTPAPGQAPLSVRVALKGRPGLEVTFDVLPEPMWFATVLREVTRC